MKIVRVKDRQFALSIPREEIQRAVLRVAEALNRDYCGKKPVFISILNGAYVFTADLLRHVTIPCEVSFVKLASYEGIASTGKIKEIVGLTENIEGRAVVIVEDIIDTGTTMKRILQTVKELGAASVAVATLLLKPDKLKVKLDVDYAAMKIPNDFIVGYGMDYDGYGRNLPDIYTLYEPGEE